MDGILESMILKRPFSKTAIPIVLLGAILIISACNKAKIINPPNIIYIFTDDLGYGDIGVFGANDIKTPNIDRIAAEGIKFTEFYSASAICTPSRAGLLTGRYPQRMGVNGVFFPESFEGMPQEEITIAEMLKQVGYSTGLIGKWHLGHQQKYLPLAQGFDEYFGIPYSNDMESVVYMRGNDVVSHQVDQTQLTKTYTKEAIEYIENHKDESFFLYVSHNMPHVPIYASDEFIGSSERGLYGDVIQELDWSVGEILKKLEQDDLLENTIIVFSSDNGPWLVMEDHGGSAGGLKEGKMYSFEGGMRVPTVAMWKGNIPEGIVYEDMATQMDWLPTFAHLAGATIPKDRVIDGKDISEVLLNNGRREDDGFLYFEGEILTGYRKGEWKIKRPFAGFEEQRWKNGSPPHDTLLIHLKNDPFELNNLFNENKNLTRSLFEEMEQKYSEMGKLPRNIVLRTPADESHYEYLEKKN